MLKFLHGVTEEVHGLKVIPVYSCCSFLSISPTRSTLKLSKKNYLVIHRKKKKKKKDLTTSSIHPLFFSYTTKNYIDSKGKKGNTTFIPLFCRGLRSHIRNPLINIPQTLLTCQEKKPQRVTTTYSNYTRMTKQLIKVTLIYYQLSKTNTHTHKNKICKYDPSGKGFKRYKAGSGWWFL